MCPPQPEQAKLSSRSDERRRPVKSRRRAGHHRRALDRPPDRDRVHRGSRASGRNARRLRRARSRHRDARDLDLAAVPGITVGHWTDLRTATGCTVVLAPAGGMRAACAVRGRATGTREIDALDPRHLVGHIDAVLLTGGSAYGLGAADGVMRWLKERGRGFPVGPAGVVPIVPTAVIFDFDLAPGSKADRWPGAD